MILVVDHYDSFTYNLVQLLESLGTTTEVVKSDAETAEALVARRPDAVVLSPGPGRPEDAGCFTELLRILPASTPVLGVCLGHQAMGIVAGARVERATPVHGKASLVHHDGTGIFADVPNPFEAGQVPLARRDPRGLPRRARADRLERRRPRDGGPPPDAAAGSGSSSTRSRS